MEVFQHYATYYDRLYADKDYEAEVGFLEVIFRRFSHSKPEVILDAGCGTGGHALPLARRGYQVMGVDASQAMLDLAKAKAQNQGLVIGFRQSDIRHLDLGKKFDACICMFAVLSYQIGNQDIQAALASIRQHLKEATLFIADFWYGPAVLIVQPSVRIKTIQDGRRRILRYAEPSLDILSHTNETLYRLLVIDEDRIIEEVEEHHRVRFFFPQELHHYLEESGFELLQLCPFLALDETLTAQSWNATVIARAV
jgi:2-polyprenyl-3-methyl-5-hydroxy-6-metoxy-1,4-benzoquinol methylase